MEWSCMMCTLINRVHRETCEACGSPKPVHEIDIDVVPENLADWKHLFKALDTKQRTALKTDTEVQKVLNEENLTLIMRTWSDVGRGFGSSGGMNITDMQFFAVCPGDFRPENYKHQPEDSFICFPAIRPPNYSDEVDLMRSGDIQMKVKNRWGGVVDITLRDFLKNIGHFIHEIDMDADWSDPIDGEHMQVSSQFSILPAPTGRADVGITAFGYQKKNLHIIVGPSGDIGWKPETNGASRIYFRKDEELVTVALVPEERKEVNKAFFKKKEENETIEEEAKRYKAVENFVYHIQIEMNVEREIRSRGYFGGPSFSGFGASEENYYFDEEDCIHEDCAEVSDVSEAEGFGFLSATTESCLYSAVEPQSNNMMDMMSFNTFSAAPAAPMMPMMQSKIMQHCEMESAPMPVMRGAAPKRKLRRKKERKADLQLARVVAGDKVGDVDDSDRVQKRKNGDYCQRQSGVAVRLTKMYYAIVEDGAINAERLEKFTSQMSFERRARGLQHGSLVTGYGTWGTPEMAPIKLQRCPAAMGAIYPVLAPLAVGDIVKLVVADDVFPPEFRDLGVGALKTIEEGDISAEVTKEKDGSFIIRKAGGEAVVAEN